jgi:hypothetical protein
MKSIKLLVITSLLIFGCKSPEKLLQEGDYDTVIKKSIKNILKGKADNSDKELLDKAYNLANQQNIERIKYLKAENRPENWEEIFRHYNALNRRQNEVRKVTPLTIGNRKISYEYTDYTRDMVEAKTKAAKFYYNAGLDNMKLQSKDGYRQAYFNFQKVKEYRESDYPDLQNLILDAKYYGTSRVLIEVIGNARIQLPDDFYDNIGNINVSGMNSTWVEYYLEDRNRDMHYDYYITVELQDILVSPDELTKREYVKTREIQDGFEYVLDRRGNVRKDSLGNDIKVPKYVQISCKVIEAKQFKTATINGVIKYRSVHPKNIFKSEPVAATSVFEHMTARAFGNLEALDPAELKLLRHEVLPFPDDLSLIHDCTDILRQAFSDLIRANKNRIY